MATPSVSATPPLSHTVSFLYPEPWEFDQVARIDKTTTLNSKEYPKAEVEKMRNFFSKYFQTCIYQVKNPGVREPTARLGIYLNPSPIFTLIPSANRDKNLGPIDYSQVIKIPTVSANFMEAKEVKYAPDIQREGEFSEANIYLETITRDAHVASDKATGGTQTMKETWRKILDLFPKWSVLQFKPKVTSPVIESYEPKTRQYLLVQWHNNNDLRERGSVVLISQRAVDQLTSLRQGHDQDIVDHHFQNLVAQETLSLPALPVLQEARRSALPVVRDPLSPSSLPSITVSLIPKNESTSSGSSYPQINFVE